LGFITGLAVFPLVVMLMDNFWTSPPTNDPPIKISSQYRHTCEYILSQPLDPLSIPDELDEFKKLLRNKLHKEFLIERYTCEGKNSPRRIAVDLAMPRNSSPPRASIKIKSGSIEQSDVEPVVRITTWLTDVPTDEIIVTNQNDHMLFDGEYNL
jgi:hypothetical protein